MGRYAKNYAYEWADNLIYFCSDPFNRFPDQRRQDRASLVLSALDKYDSQPGKRILDLDESAREKFIEFLSLETSKYYSDNNEQNFRLIRKGIEEIVNNNGNAD
ncbi:MAG: hypothetical protein AABW41_04865 [Nanoarchaeota archaeon]